MLAAFKQKYIGDRAFYKRYLFLAIPMIIQNFITNFVSFLDNIMVGQLGTEQMAGVAIVNQLNFVYSLATFGMVAAAGIFGAQFYGKGDAEGHMYTFRFRLLGTLFVTVAALFIFAFLGGDLVSLYLTQGDSTSNINLAYGYAMEYLHIILFGLIPFAFTQAYASIIKETGQSFVPMVAGLSGVISNAILDYLLIFGIGFFPKLGVSGAALATVIARFIESGIVISWAHSHTNENKYLVNAYKSLVIPRELVGRILVKGAPLMLNEVLWAAGITALTQSYSVRGLDVVAALNIANTINNLFNIVFIQLGGCISIIVGQYLGAGELERAKDADNKMIFFSVASCVVMAALMFMVGHLFPAIYNTSPEIKALATSFIYIQALSMPFCAFSHCSYFTIRSGGKTLVTFLFDSVFTWVVMVSTAKLLLAFTALPIVTIFFIVTFTELIKNLMGYIMVKSNVWLVQMV
ncbi:MAG: MATE family efflux transporter [Pseudobutyrivibrio sp.]|nr:MATE family efflux transporter [Pseudobutyrivibrio sp.]